MNATETTQPDETETELEPDEELEPSAIETELEPDDETEPETETPPADDEQSAQAMLKALEKEESRHRNALAKALGLEVEELHECPTCQATGYTPEPVDAPPPLKQDPFTETCERCAGNGRTLSGASALAMFEIPCNDCSGQGYKVKAEQPTAGSSFASGPAELPAYAPPAAPSPGDPAAIAALRAQGYMIMDPITVPPATPA